MSINTEKLKELDGHWKEVMDLAEGYGFICQAYGGTATLATHANQLEAFGEEKYLDRQQQMFRNDMKRPEEGTGQSPVKKEDMSRTCGFAYITLLEKRRRGEITEEEFLSYYTDHCGKCRHMDGECTYQD